MVMLRVGEDVAASRNLASLTLWAVGGSGRLTENVIERSCRVCILKDRIAMYISEGQRSDAEQFVSSHWTPDI